MTDELEKEPIEDDEIEGTDETEDEEKEDDVTEVDDDGDLTPDDAKVN